MTAYNFKKKINPLCQTSSGRYQQLCKLILFNSNNIKYTGFSFCIFKKITILNFKFYSSRISKILKHSKIFTIFWSLFCNTFFKNFIKITNPPRIKKDPAIKQRTNESSHFLNFKNSSKKIQIQKNLRTLLTSPHY